MGLRVAHVTNNLRITTGTQDFTSSGLGTITGCVVLLSQASVNNTETSHAQISIGMADGTRQRVVSANAEDGQTTEDTQFESQNAAVALLCTPGTGVDVVRVSFSSFITDGVRLSVDLTDGVAYIASVILFGGCTCEVTDITITGIGTEATATLGHSEQVKGVIVAGCGASSNSATSGGMRFSFGFSSYSGSITQRAISRLGGNGTATTRHSANFASDRVGVGDLNITTGAEVFGGEMTTMSTGSIGITGRGSSASNRNFICLCLSGFSENLYVGDFNTASSTGDSAYSSIGFKPQCIVGASSILDSAESNNGTGRGGGIGAFGWDRRGPGPSSVTNHLSTTDEDNVGTSREKSWSNNVAIESYSETGSLIARSTLVSFDTSGFTLNWSTADATNQRRNIFMAFQEEGGGVSIGMAFGNRGAAFNGGRVLIGRAIR